MPEPFGTGEETTRLRRILDLRGQFPMQVDETIVPVIQLDRGDKAPFRRSERRWFTFLTVNPGAGLLATVELANRTRSFIMVDRISAEVVLPAATQRSLISVGILQTTTNPIAGAAFTMETNTPGVAFQRVGVDLQAVLAPGAVLWSDMTDPAGQTIGLGNEAIMRIQDFDLAIAPGFSMSLVTTSPDQATAFFVSGRVFEDVPHNAST